MSASALDESGPWLDADEPAPADFEAAEDEHPEAGLKAAVVKALKVVTALLIIAALLFYFVAPFNNIFSGVPFHWRPPVMRLRTIPLAPQHRTFSTLPV